MVENKDSVEINNLVEYYCQSIWKMTW
jgi:hypothetical protein